MVSGKEQKINVLKDLLVEEQKKRAELAEQLIIMQTQIKMSDTTILIFQKQLDELLGVDKTKVRKVLRGAEIGEAAIVALRKLGRAANAKDVKAEIEKVHDLSGHTEKSKQDQVWNSMNDHPLLEKVSRGNFYFKKS